MMDPIEVPCTGCGAQAGEPCAYKTAPWDPPVGICDRQKAQADAKFATDRQDP